MRGVRDEQSLGIERCIEAFEQPVDRGGKPRELIGRPFEREALVEITAEICRVVAVIVRNGASTRPATIQPSSIEASAITASAIADQITS